MSSYPARNISSLEDRINILQITDMHLSSAGERTNKDWGSRPCCATSFEAVIKQALNEDIHCDLILVTGDLVSKIKPAIYDYIFEVLEATNIPFACIAGNHDVTDELNSELPFPERQLIAHPADKRLLNRHVIDTDYWQILLLNSAIPGKVSGAITEADIRWLCQQLETCDKPALLALHHHVLLIDSDWMDAHMTENAERFWQHMAAYANLRVIISGHVHQEQVSNYQGVTVYTTPSTCYQYKPYEDEFAYDKAAKPGYRWLQLANNGQVASWIKRLDT